MQSLPSSEQSWVVDEFLGVDLGDRRREVRLIQLAAELAENPTKSLPEALSSSAALKAAYRFFENDAISSDELLSGHVLSTIQRAKSSESDVLLAIQDTTELDYSSHKAKKGTGHLGYNTGANLHTTLLSTVSGVPLGLLQQLVWARPKKAKKSTRHERANIPIEQKESYKWLQSVQQLNDIAQMLGDVTLLSVGDRDADLFEFFAQEREPNVEFLVRAGQNRVVENSDKLLKQTLQAQSISGTVCFNIPRRGNQEARDVRASVRWSQLKLKVPKRLKYHGYKESVTVWGVLLEEENPPKGVIPVNWLLLTTMEVDSFEKALEIVSWYTRRWLIELFHKVLKSGCKVEELQLGDMESIKRAIPVYSVLAWRILYLTMIARESPDAPVSTVLTKDEWEALYCAIHRVREPTRKEPSLGEALRWIAKLGGFLGRKSDGEPGMIVIWRGLRKLTNLTDMYRIMKPPVESISLDECDLRVCPYQKP